MKNTAIHTLDYSGIVTLSQQIGKKKVKIAQAHNKGGATLFNFLAHCLIGKFNANEVPRKIKLLNHEVRDNNIDVYNSASGFIYWRNDPDLLFSDSGECRVRYSFMIPRDMIENINNINTLGLGLYALNALESNPDDFMAFCTIKFNRNQIVNSALLVDWDLVIANKKSSPITGN